MTAIARTPVLPEATLVGALLIQVLISLANIAAADHARPARSLGNPQFKRSTAATSMKARSTSLAASRTAAAARGHPHRPNNFVFSTVESAPTNRVFQDLRSGRWRGSSPIRDANKINHLRETAENTIFGTDRTRGADP